MVVAAISALLVRAMTSAHREAAPMTTTDCTTVRAAVAHLHAVMLLRRPDGSIGRFRA
jgi:hypothetical protein